MSNKIKDIYRENNRYYFFDDIINNIQNFDPNNVRIDEKSYKDILIYICYIGYIIIKDSKFVKINSVILYTLFSAK